MSRFGLNLQNSVGIWEMAGLLVRGQLESGIILGSLDSWTAMEMTRESVFIDEQYTCLFCGIYLRYAINLYLSRALAFKTD